MTKQTVISFAMLVKASKPLIIKVDLPFASTWIHPSFLVWTLFSFVVVLLCVFTFWVPCSASNDVRFVFTSSCLWEGSCLIYVICVLVLFIFVLCIMYPMLPVSLDCSCLIAPSVFSNVYLRKGVLIHSKTLEAQAWPWNERINSLFLMVYLT
jgi:hypothetical protein